MNCAALVGNPGELGLKAAGSQDYFGVIYIGDTPAFKGLVEADGAGIMVSDDALNGSLFGRINESNSTVEVLAGARKFIEGWNSWRVSNMGLLNIGQSEGSQIIQLFGRGVRLRGRGMTLKRSSALNDRPHPEYIRLLETLNIFALRANYMTQFRDYLESEGINTQESVELPLFIQPNGDFLNKGLVIPALDEGKTIRRPGNRVVAIRCRGWSGFRGDVSHGPTNRKWDGRKSPIPAPHQELNGRYRWRASTWWTGTWPIWNCWNTRKRKVSATCWSVRYFCVPYWKPGRRRTCWKPMNPWLSPKCHEGQQRLQEAITNILRKYTDTLYRRRQAIWESDNLTYRQLGPH